MTEKVEAGFVLQAGGGSVIEGYHLGAKFTGDLQKAKVFDTATDMLAFVQKHRFMSSYTVLAVSRGGLSIIGKA